MKTNDIYKCFLSVICAGAVFSCLAESNTSAELVSSMEKINRAIIKFEQTKRENWSYSIARYEDEEGDISSSIEHYSPPVYSGEGKSWLLKQINGAQPTQKQIKHFDKTKQAQNENQGSNIKLKLRELINQESLSLLSINDTQIIMAFNVNFKKLGADAVGKLQGQLTYQKEAQFIEEISIWNNAHFSPMFTANITDLAITFTFVEVNGAVLTKQNDMKLKARFAYFTEINETSVDVFSDYQYEGK
jgi:hypothetical protein